MVSVARRVKGTDVAGAVKALRKLRRRGELPELSAAVAALVDQRILPASWYPMETVRDLLAIVHQKWFDGTDDGALAMGRMGARETLAGLQAAYVADGDPVRTLGALERIWRAHYDFGHAETEVDGAGALFRLSGYPDMPRWHGFIIAGWVMAAIEMAGAKDVRVAVRGGPWVDAAAPFVAAVTWQATARP
jgi:uncharacterized protein (TIGR02265 family)